MIPVSTAIHLSDEDGAALEASFVGRWAITGGYLRNKDNTHFTSYLVEERDLIHFAALAQR